jgi:hypothetical protein
MRPPDQEIPTAKVPTIRFIGVSGTCASLDLNGVPSILSIEVTAAAALHGTILRLSVHPPESEPVTLFATGLESIAENRSLSVDTSEVRLPSRLLQGFTERSQVDLMAILTDAEGSMIAKAEHRLSIIPSSHWFGTSSSPESIAAFVTPNSPAIAPLLRAASAYLHERTGNGALDGYQSRSASRVQFIAEACFKALAARAIQYVPGQPSYESQGQKVRHAADVLSEGLGNCLDLAVTLAALFEACGLNALILMSLSHATVGFHVEDNDLEAHQSGQSILTRLDLGEIRVIEATLACNGSSSFAESLGMGEKWARSTGENLGTIDIRASRRAGFHPLPERLAQQERSGLNATASPPDNEWCVVQPKDLPPIRSSKQAPHEQRIEAWRKRLLDLSLRNPLLNDTDRSGLPLLVENQSVIAMLEDVLWDEKPLRIAPAHAAKNLSADAAIEELQRGIVRSPMSETEVLNRATKAFRSGRSSIEETGARSLFVAIGFLEYKVEARSTPIKAPLILVPVELERISRSEGFRVKGTSEDSVPNVALIESLKVSQGLDLGLGSGRTAELDEDAKGLDIPAILDRVRQAVKDLPGARVIPIAKLGTYAFRKLPLFEELRERGHAITEHAIVRSLLERRSTETLENFPVVQPSDVERLTSFQKLALPLAADSSQTAAVISASQGSTFVLQGPPGTGKSQTITNLIANSIALGKRVLFVAEKSAALGVVSHRLAKAGLSDFALDLHADHATKANFVQQIQSALVEIEPRSSGQPDKFGQIAQELDKHREDLNSALGALHSPLESEGATMHDVIEDALQAGESSGEQELPMGVLDAAVSEQISPLQVRSKLRLLESLQEAHRSVASFPGPLPDWVCPAEVPKLSLFEQDAIEAESCLSDMCDHVGTLSARLGVPFTQSLGWFRASAQVIREIFKEKPIPEVINAAILAPDHRGRLEAILHAVQVHINTAKASAELAQQFDFGVLSLPLETLLADLRVARTQFFLVRFFSVRKIRISIARFAKELPPSDLDALIATVDGILAKKKIIDLGVKADPSLQQLVEQGGSDVLGPLCETIRSSISSADLLKRIFPEHLNTLAQHLANPTRAREISELAHTCITLVDQAKHVLTRLESSTCEAGALLGETLPASTVQDRVGMIVRCASQLPDVARFNIIRRRMRGEHLAPVESSLLGASSDQAFAAAKHELISAWIRSRVKADAGLASCIGAFNARLRQRLDESLRKYCASIPNNLANVARQRIRRELARKDDPSMIKATKYLNELRAVSTIRRPIRRVMREAGTALAALKPIVLASPLSAATLLPSDFPAFDLVVFDEASQVPVWDAACALSRGRSAVIVGDSKQLPPTNFFEKKDLGETVSEDEDVFDHLESVLDEAVASGIPQLSLLWHYRSRDERLIEFSNRRSYLGRLQTFPSSHRTHPNLGVEFRFIGGTYACGEGANNLQEAEAIVEELARRLKDPNDCAANRSLGVVTFSLSQATLIQDLFDEALEEDESLRTAVAETTAHGEAPFIKNLENVQGDERATMLFSIGFGKDANGRFRHGFGPLSFAGGERRLNVAITRAQEKVIIFSSIRASDLDPEKCRAQGAKDLRDYLAFAELGTVPTVRSSLGQSTEQEVNAVERVLARGLEERGWKVDFHVGRSRDFRLSLAIRDPEHEDRWVLGIELDGPFHRAASSVIDRESVRGQVLKGLGWNLFRVSALDVLSDLTNTIKAIEEHLPKKSQPA